jgi:hypothetical protein
MRARPDASSVMVPVAVIVAGPADVSIVVGVMVKFTSTGGVESAVAPATDVVARTAVTSASAPTTTTTRRALSQSLESACLRLTSHSLLLNAPRMKSRFGPRPRGRS